MNTLQPKAWLRAGNPGQPALILLHGFMGSRLDWQPFLPTLSRYFYCLCPDLPAHGQNRELCLNFAEIAPYLLSSLKQMGIERFHLLGYSMGGRIALSLLAQAPERVQSLILESGFPGFRSDSERQARRLLDRTQADALRSDLSAFVSKWYQLPLWGKLAESADFSDLLASRQQNDPEALARSLLQAGAAEQPDYWPLLAELQQPALYLVGTQDPKYLSIASELECLNRRIHCLRLEAGHNIHAQSPVAWLQTVLNFLISKQS